MPDLTRSHIEEAIRELTDRYMFQAVTPMTQATFAIDVANALDIPHGWVRTEHTLKNGKWTLSAIISIPEEGRNA
jgi:hypothetical protein